MDGHERYLMQQYLRYTALMDNEVKSLLAGNGRWEESLWHYYSAVRSTVYRELKTLWKVKEVE